MADVIRLKRMPSNPFEPPASTDDLKNASTGDTNWTDYVFALVCIAVLAANYIYGVLCAQGSLGRAKPEWFITPATLWLAVFLGVAYLRFAGYFGFRQSRKWFLVAMSSMSGTTINLWFLNQLMAVV
ncbi:hypothetical protein K227x_22760 [Rubripirellula lacrimiformis]|uniref:Uncharacterized protein n=2 Tax=Rubripirellula lacrimiformis TaxID=1930273 RepID=A0A517N9T0_9BACT|nr:hypothetical protein K227x_22760 [Rubripirellula lacrimiformis]